MLLFNYGACSYPPPHHNWYSYFLYKMKCRMIYIMFQHLKILNKWFYGHNKVYESLLDTIEE